MIYAGIDMSYFAKVFDQNDGLAPATFAKAFGEDTPLVDDDFLLLADSPSADQVKEEFHDTKCIAAIEYWKELIDAWLKGVRKMNNSDNIQAYLDFLVFKTNDGSLEDLMKLLTHGYQSGKILDATK